LLGFAEGIDTNAVQECIDSGETKSIVQQKFDIGRNIFGVTGTPGNVLINNET